MAAAPDSEPVTDVLDKVHQKNEMRSGGSLSLDEVHRQLSENLKKSGKDDLRILVTGRTGAGKSALVNSIVGEYVAMEGDSPFRQTTEVTKYEKVVGDIAIAIYDSPGLQLQDGVEDEKEYLKDLEQNCKEVDLNLYCIRMDDRLQYKEKEAMKKLSKAFGMDEFWKNTLIVLTFANKINPQKTASLTPVDVFSKRMSEWKFLLRRVLIDKAGVSEKVAEEVPVVPVGCSDKPSLPAARCDYWLSDLWRQSLKRAKGIAKPILLNFNREQLRPSGEKMDEQPINPPGEKAPSRFVAYMYIKQLQ